MWWQRCPHQCWGIIVHCLVIHVNTNCFLVDVECHVVHFEFILYVTVVYFCWLLQGWLSVPADNRLEILISLLSGLLRKCSSLADLLCTWIALFRVQTMLLAVKSPVWCNARSQKNRVDFCRYLGRCSPTFVATEHSYAEHNIVSAFPSIWLSVYHALVLYYGDCIIKKWTLFGSWGFLIFSHQKILVKFHLSLMPNIAG